MAIVAVRCRALFSFRLKIRRFFRDFFEVRVAWQGSSCVSTLDIHVLELLLRFRYKPAKFVLKLVFLDSDHIALQGFISEVQSPASSL